MDLNKIKHASFPSQHFHNCPLCPPYPTLMESPTHWRFLFSRASVKGISRLDMMEGYILSLESPHNPSSLIPT